MIEPEMTKTHSISIAVRWGFQLLVLTFFTGTHTLERPWTEELPRDQEDLVESNASSRSFLSMPVIPTPPT